jgi:REP element-mobilizing transposase RayT
MHTKEVFRRRRLPHLDLTGAVYFVTSCLHSSIPAQGLLEVRCLRRKLASGRPPAGMTMNEWRVARWNQMFLRAEHWLDQEPVVRHFADARLAETVVASMYHFAGVRYDLLAFVVMPSHLHWVFQPRADWVDSLGVSAGKRPPRERIMHTIKTRTGWECNKLLERQGAFWQDESYDHCVRDEEELGRIIRYVEENPIRAGLVSVPEDWPFSSARVRSAGQIPYGQPLPPLVGQAARPARVLE